MAVLGILFNHQGQGGSQMFLCRLPSPPVPGVWLRGQLRGHCSCSSCSSGNSSWALSSSLPLWGKLGSIHSPQNQMFASGYPGKPCCSSKAAWQSLDLQGKEMIKGTVTASPLCPASLLDVALGKTSSRNFCPASAALGE